MLPTSLVAFVLIGARFGMVSAAERIPSEEIVVFQKAIDDRRTVAVVIGKPFAPNLLKGLMKAEYVEQLTALRPIRVELRQPGEPDIVLVSRLKAEGQAEFTRGFDVLDMLIEPGRIILAATEGAGIVLWQVGVPDERLTRWGVPGGEWAAAAAMSKLDRNNVGITLGRSKAGVLTVEIVDRRIAAPHQHTVFEQIADQWEFRVLKSWRAK